MEPIDKSTWGEGEWQSEPDVEFWTDAATGLHCFARRHPFHGGWCGYVGVSESHPLWGVDYDDVDEQLEVHGGVTFAGHFDDKTWWFGFDCMHAQDISPGMDARLREIDGSALLFRGDWAHYRHLEYVHKEVASLAAQLGEME